MHSPSKYSSISPVFCTNKHLDSKSCHITMAVHTPLRSLFGLLCVFLFVIVGANSTPQDPSASPLADTELICPTEHAGDCYPRVFQPTEEFQLIKEGQDIPPGLHVRLNIYTGEKEARLNIPMEGEEDPTLKGVPVEQAMVVVDQPKQESEELKQVPIPPNAPPYEPAGKIQSPPPNSGDSVIFNTARLTIVTDGPDFDTALDGLSEIAHDIYYGVEIVKDRPTVEKLFCYAFGLGSEIFPATENQRDYKAASILASAIQNNPTALEEITKVKYPICSSGAVGNMASGPENTVQIFMNTLKSGNEPSTLKARITLMGGLMKEPGMRDGFLEAGAMELLLAIWLREGDQWDAVRIKLAQLVMDNFLDASMGAELKVWPKEPASPSRVCESKDRMLEDGCWEHHLESFLKASPHSSWAKDFLEGLREQRSKVTVSISHSEL
jgi:nucleotide exchange factor SIL1